MERPIINFESLSKPHWSEADQSNAKAVVKFVQLIMNDHNFDEILNRFSGQTYTQHNRTIPDGIEGVVKTVSALVKTSPEFSYDVKHIFVDGEHVILHSHATLKAKHRGDESQGMNIIDTWRLDQGKLVEHWDSVEGISFSMRLYSLLTGGQRKNSNSIF
ncbi:nuclear transport factor 2 family protein [Vibrio hannami]|uniref:nuclear transport factor 2 family protein n=1 Tax=Vibrio hannami TaxID=2717094 RepID=UPI00240EA307|nr:nuclear transport factor 2 family protein [Vibrio hannami]MDG3086474.1 nuclear transport factor 2 family protein [Vibrio hannami]